MQGVLRDGLLEGTTVLTAPATGVTAACARLGAEVRTLDTDLFDEDATAAAVPPCAALVVDAAALFGDGGPDALRYALDATWSAVRATANAAFIPAEGGKVVLVAPRPAAGDHAPALRAGLENLARVSSIEWARHAITPTAVLPGPQSSDDEVAEVVAYLVSRAGDYFAGTLLDMQ